MDQYLKGKIAFVSGSGRGLGSVMATRLAQRGANVAVHDLSWDATAKYGESADLGVMQKKIEALGVRSTAVTGNIGDQNYELPADADLAKYRAVTIWCKRFSVNFGTAPLMNGSMQSMNMQ